MMSFLDPYIGAIKAIALLAIMLGLLWTGHHYGAQGAQAKWDKANLEAEQAADKDRMRKQEAINGYDQKFAVKAQKDRVITQTIIKEVEKYVPNTLAMLPGDFRLYLDAAATGQEIDDTRRADAAPVAPQVVAGSVAENYASCNYDKFRLETLQQIVKTMNSAP